MLERLRHLSFSKLRLLAHMGIIPKDLTSVDPPICPGGAYGKVHQCQW